MLCLFSVYLASINAVYVYSSMFYEFKKTKKGSLTFQKRLEMTA